MEYVVSEAVEARRFELCEWCEKRVDPAKHLCCMMPIDRLLLVSKTVRSRDYNSLVNGLYHSGICDASYSAFQPNIGNVFSLSITQLQGIVGIGLRTAHRLAVLTILDPRGTQTVLSRTAPAEWFKPHEPLSRNNYPDEVTCCDLSRFAKGNL